MAKLFLDTEFTGLHKDTTLISIGLIDEEDRCFYGEIIDYDKNQVDYWIQKNVIENLWYEKGIRIRNMNVTYCKGTKKEVASKLNNWLSVYKEIEWVSDVCHYDFVLLIDLLYKNANYIPYNEIGAAIHDINQDIAKHYNISELKAFDKSREDIIKEHNIKISGIKHNALYDAKVIKAIYEIVNKPKLTVGVEIKDIDELKWIFEIIQDKRIPKDIAWEYYNKFIEKRQ